MGTQTNEGQGSNARCTICGFVVAGLVAPPHCPECGARAAMFEPTVEPPHGIEHNPFQPHDTRDQLAELLGPGVSGCVEND